MWKITKVLTDIENKIKTRKARKLALKNAKTNYESLVKSIKKSQNPSEFLEDEKTQEEHTTKQEEKTTPNQEEKKSTIQTVKRHFLMVDGNKKEVSKELKKQCGKKIQWLKATKGAQNWYVSGIEGMKSDEVDKVLTEYKKYSQYFNEGKWTAKIWSRN